MDCPIHCRRISSPTLRDLELSNFLPFLSSLSLYLNRFCFSTLPYETYSETIIKYTEVTSYVVYTCPFTSISSAYIRLPSYENVTDLKLNNIFFTSRCLLRYNVLMKIFLEGTIIHTQIHTYPFIRLFIPLFSVREHQNVLSIQFLRIRFSHLHFNIPSLLLVFPNVFRLNVPKPLVSLLPTSSITLTVT